MFDIPIVMILSSLEYIYLPIIKRSMITINRSKVNIIYLKLSDNSNTNETFLNITL